ncbi:MAG: hypothetical protein KAU95_04255, partial [Candidatus Aenigmarchaeota archaeon]|nr:hypothetical protein [Candidatus Aenigmarchaeota archaeon]
MNRLYNYKPIMGLLVALIIGMVFACPVFAVVYGPVAYQTEQVYAHYHTNGTLDSSQNYSECSDSYNPCRHGYLEVALPNTNDTLQTISVNLSGITDTSLHSKEIYKAVASSWENVWDKTLLYVNDSIFGEGNYYNITNATKAPAIELSLGYSNAEGGYDLYDHDNIGSGGSTNVMNFVFNITNPSTAIALNSVQVVLQFDQNTGAGETRDILNITSAVNSSGTTTLADTGTDGDYDKLTWTGNIAANTTIQVNFTATIVETENFVDGGNSINTDSNLSDKGAKSSYSQATTLTGLTISYKYSKGPIRQGIDLMAA